MNPKCEANMCDGSGLRQAGGWHLLSPCYCEAGKQISRQMGAEPETRKPPIQIEQPVALMRAQLAALRGEVS